MADSPHRLALFTSGAVVGLVLLLCLVALVVPYDPASAVDLSVRDQGPSAAHIFGTDSQGRDVAIRVLEATEAFFLPGLLAALLAVIAGALAGAITGYLVGPVREAVLWLLQLTDTLPRLVFIILVCTILEPTMGLIALVTGVLFIPSVATVIRRKVEALGSEDYILAHIAHGFPPWRILLYHIVWLQCRSMLVRQATFVFSYVLFVETALSYLGDYGVPEPDPSWGNMVAQAKSLGAQHLSPWLFPAIAIIITISATLAFGNLVARGDEEAAR